MLTFTYESAMVVMMCTTTNSSARTLTLRCNAWVANRGQARDASVRCVEATPSTAPIVSSTKPTTAVLRVRYQSGLLSNALAVSVAEHADPQWRRPAGA